MKIEGCKKRKRHCYVGKKKSPDVNGNKTGSAEELLQNVRNDFYQTAGTVIVSFYLKKIDKSRAKVEFGSNGTTVELDLPTSDGKRFTSTLPLFASIDPEKSQFRILGTKLELTLIKSDGTSWATLRNDEQGTGERIQVGRAGRV
jgi:hypothetical protein